MNLIARSLVPFSLLVATLAWAQDYRGRVQGVVTDPLNAAITDATVTLQNTNTTTATVRRTDELGRYLFDFVEPGTYTLTAGGVMNVGMKAGTNEYHGSLYYFGRNPTFNAVSNVFTRAPNLVRNHVEGGTIGGPIRKNKLFTFFTYEKWNNRQPYTKVVTLPTDLEREGNFSRTLTKAGDLRVIFDPWTTTTDAATNKVTRQPFAGNLIPTARMDPTSRLFLNEIWKPNNPGDDLTGVNNYRTGYAWFLNYWNLSNRTDWNITPKWKL